MRCQSFCGGFFFFFEKIRHFRRFGIYPAKKRTPLRLLFFKKAQKKDRGKSPVFVFLQNRSQCVRKNITAKNKPMIIVTTSV